MPKGTIKFGYLFGVKGKRKFRSPLFGDKFSRNMSAEAHKRSGYRVRKYQKRVI